MIAQKRHALDVLEEFKELIDDCIEYGDLDKAYPQFAASDIKLVYDYVTALKKQIGNRNVVKFRKLPVREEENA